MCASQAGAQTLLDTGPTGPLQPSFCGGGIYGVSRGYWFARVDTNRIIHESVQDNIKKMLRHLVILCAAASASAFHAAPAALGPRAAPAIATRSIASPLCSEIVRGIGEGRNLPAPSGINTQPVPVQAAIVLGIFAAIGFGTVLIHGPIFDLVRGSDLWNLSRPTWPILGLIYLAAGIAHFTELEGFTNITPPNGTWGFYYTPFSPRVNVLWTGVVEVFGGAWMLFGAIAPLLGFELPAALGPVVSDGALTLMLLTAIVTPANVYALTHGANFPLDLETVRHRACRSRISAVHPVPI